MNPVALWDGDTGTVTVTASTADGPVNLSATTARHLIVRHRNTGVVTELTVTSADLPNGQVTAAAQSLGVGPYFAILRVTDGTGTYTYPSADVGPAVFSVKEDIDATA